MCTQVMSRLPEPMPRNASAADRAAADGHALADGVAVADLGLRRLAAILQILRRDADRVNG
jgi:hypothetical protein